MIEGGRQLDKEAAQEIIQLWLPQTVGCSNLQQLQLINLCSGDWDWDFDFGRTAHLKELRLDDPADRGDLFGFGISLPASITKLTDLEVLWLGTLGSSHLSDYYFWDMLYSDSDLLMDVLEQCPRLRQLGPVMGGWGNSCVPQPSEHLSCLALGMAPPWVDHIRCPALLNLTIDPTCGRVSEELLQQLAQLTSLTSLQLNTAFAYVEMNSAHSPDAGWAPLGDLAAGLCNLKRLELVNHFEEPPTPQQTFPPLTMPRLPAFTQLKQLQLACAVNHDHPLPEQLTAADLLRGLTGLTQLEQLELIGYVAVTPAVVCALIERLPKLLVLEVRRCEHPEVQVAPADGAQGLGAAGLAYYKNVQELYSQLRPKLRFELLS